MTAEIAVLNSQAVALAADSAVTVSDGTNRAPKIKRKHYFQAELNHQFFNNYFRSKEVKLNGGQTRK